MILESSTSVVGIEILSGRTFDRSEDKFLADSEVILVETGRTIASVDFRSEDGVEGTDGASSLEGEVSGSA